MGHAVKACALDFDGVLVDSMPLQEQAWREALEAGGQRIPAAAAERILANLWEGCAGEQIFAGSGLSEVAAHQARQRKDAAWERLQPSVRLMPGAAAALQRLASTTPLYIATTAARRYVEQTLQRESLAGYIAAIYTNQDVARPKPAPDMLLRIAAAAGIAMRELLMIGDTPTDLRMAHSAGCLFLLMDCYGRNRGDQPDVASVRGWGEVVRWILGQAASKLD